tara:strand:+ start:183 stop:902 length:720 start_codon:yes stop_codon:yes gene_type:complete
MTEKIRALLLSGGYGTRLRPLTEKIPKCLIEINGKPMLEHWLSKLEKIECEACLINTHYLSEKVNKFIKSRKKSKMIIKEVYEEELFGTAGTLIKNLDFFKNCKILMIHTDNMTNFDLTELIIADSKKPKDCLFTMLTFNTDCPQSSGIVVKNNNQILENFFEKVADPPSNIANGAIYLLDQEFINNLKTDNPEAKDFSLEVIPRYLGKIFTYHTENLLIDVGTKENLLKAKLKFKNKN